MNSAIFVGGYNVLMATLIIASCIILFLPSGWGWSRVRIAALFVAWQAFTPIRDNLTLDLVLFLLACGAMEGVYLLRRRNTRG